MKLNKSILLTIVATLALGLSVGCNGGKKSKKSKKSAETETAAPKCEPAEEAAKKVEPSDPDQVAQKRLSLYSSLSSLASIKMSGVACGADVQQAIFVYPNQLDEKTYVLEVLKGPRATVQDIKNALKQVRTNMMKQADSQCNLVAISKVAKIYKGQIAGLELGDKEEEGADELYAKIQVIVDELGPVAERSEQVIKAQREQQAAAELLERRDSAIVALNTKMDLLEKIKSQLFQVAQCAEIEPMQVVCEDQDAQAYASSIRDFELEVNAFTSEIPKDLYTATSADKMFQIQPMVEMMEDLLDRADGLYSAAP